MAAQLASLMAAGYSGEVGEEKTELTLTSVPSRPSLGLYTVVGTTETLTPTPDVDEWLRQGDQIRRKLQEERDQLSARIAEIDEKLRRLQGGIESAKPQDGGVLGTAPVKGVGPTVTSGVRQTRTLTGATVSVPDGASAPDLVRAILEAHPEGLMAVDIISEAVSLQPKIDPRNIHSALQRSPMFEKTGKARKYTYYLAAKAKRPPAGVPSMLDPQTTERRR